jgi:hypothetical protein
MKRLAESTTKTIRRSQIRLNPLNPKRHTDEKIRFQKRNFQKVGYMGGIVWNEVTGNLVDGHRRIQAMDAYYRYDGTPDTDYDVKVEAVRLDEKAEKEQMTYMALGNTKADYNLVSKYVGEIDFKAAGLDREEYEKMTAIANAVTEKIQTPIVTFGDLIEQAPAAGDVPPSPGESREQIRAKKQQQAETAARRQDDGNAFVTVSFSSYENMVGFCEMFGYDPETTKFIKGEEMMAKLNDMM